MFALKHVDMGSLGHRNKHLNHLIVETTVLLNNTKGFNKKLRTDFKLKIIHLINNLLVTVAREV